jgi:hypothetical protein
MSIVRKDNQHTRPSQHVAASNGKVYSPARIKAMAHSSGLSAAQIRLGSGWDWYISRNGAPLFQGGSGEVAVWLHGYMRGSEAP